jgi:F-type H+-transporting ATPase subunit a
VLLFFPISHFGFSVINPSLPIFAANLKSGMTCRGIKSLLVAVFSLCISIFSNIALAQHEEPATGKAASDHGEEKKKGFNAQEVIFGHVLNGHEFHFFDYFDAQGVKHPVTIPLPVILYSPQRGLTAFMSSKFEHGHKSYKGYKLHEGKVVAVNEPNDAINETVKVYDISLTRNVVQMILALVIFTWVMLSIANRYKKGIGVNTAPRGAQSLMEPIITFIRDEVARPNLGHKYEKYFPYLLTVFFFILINNIFGLIPGSANVTGNIAFTLVLGVISFIVILFSSKKHFWGHIFNPPGVPVFVKPILTLVEFLSVFIKPFALIIRLFANMVAGHIIIICLISLIFIFAELHPAIGWGASPVSILFTVFIYLIEFLIAFLQAYIFTMLTAVFVGQAFEGEHHHDDAKAHITK